MTVTEMEEAEVVAVEGEEAVAVEGEDVAVDAPVVLEAADEEA